MMEDEYEENYNTTDPEDADDEVYFEQYFREDSDDDEIFAGRLGAPINQINRNVSLSAAKAKEMISLLKTGIRIEDPELAFSKIQPTAEVLDVPENKRAIRLLKIMIGQHIGPEARFNTAPVEQAFQ